MFLTDLYTPRRNNVYRMFWIYIKLQFGPKDRSHSIEDKDLGCTKFLISSLKKVLVVWLWNRCTASALLIRRFSWLLTLILMEGCFKVVIIMEEQKTLLKKLGQNFTFEGFFFDYVCIPKLFWIRWFWQVECNCFNLKWKNHLTHRILVLRLLKWPLELPLVIERSLKNGLYFLSCFIFQDWVLLKSIFGHSRPNLVGLI